MHKSISDLMRKTFQNRSSFGFCIRRNAILAVKTRIDLFSSSSQSDRHVSVVCTLHSYFEINVCSHITTSTLLPNNMNNFPVGQYYDAKRTTYANAWICINIDFIFRRSFCLFSIFTTKLSADFTQVVSKMKT